MDTKSITSCCDCPFLHHYPHSGSGDDYCEHPDADDDANLSYPEVRWPPDWCHLRTGPVTVELEAGS